MTDTPAQLIRIPSRPIVKDISLDILNAVKENLFYDGSWPIIRARLHYCSPLAPGETNGVSIEYEHPWVEAELSVPRSIALKPRGILHFQDSGSAISALGFTLLYSLSVEGLIPEIPKSSLEELSAGRGEKGAFIKRVDGADYRGIINPQSFPGRIKMKKIKRNPDGSGMVNATGYLGQRNEHVYEDIVFGIKT